MRKELTLTELDGQTADLLPERETLSWGSSNFAGILASNTSVALNAASYGSSATSTANQSISVWQG